MPEQKPSKNSNKRSVKDKFKDAIDNLKKQKSFDDWYTYASSNKRDTLAYAMLVLGIILLFFRPFIGELLIGAVLGVYFAEDIYAIWKNLDERIEREGMARSLTLAAVFLALFIAAPGIFLGALIVLGIKLLLAAS
jgi:hypothetical protein